MTRPIGQAVLLIVAIISLLTAPPVGATTELPPGGTFYDDDTSVHAGSIEAIAAAGITRGCNPPINTRFCPTDHVSRGEMAAFLNRALPLPQTEPTAFTDVAESVFAADIERLAAAGITRGCNPPENTRFCPSEPVTRGQMAAFLVRALDLPPSTVDRFVDDEHSVFADAINRLAGAAITQGCNPPANDRFCPEAPVSRAEMASFLTRGLALDIPLVAPRPYQIEVVPREHWGALPPRGTFSLHEIEEITIHHGGAGSTASGAALYRIWQNWHRHLGWPDLAYHFIIGLDGEIYEGRPINAIGDTATEYDPTGHLLIVVEGDFDDHDPTAAQLESLAQMIAWASAYFDVPTITGHRDHAATTCPGDRLYAHIDDGSLADRATEIVTEGGVTLQIGNAE